MMTIKNSENNLKEITCKDCNTVFLVQIIKSPHEDYVNALDCHIHQMDKFGTKKGKIRRFFENQDIALGAMLGTTFASFVCIITHLCTK